MHGVPRHVPGQFLTQELTSFPLLAIATAPCRLDGNAGGFRARQEMHRGYTLRCVRMTAINLAFRNLYGHVIWGNTLRLEQKLVYRTGFDLRGFVREIPVGECPAPVQRMAVEEQSEATTESSPTDRPRPATDDWCAGTGDRATARTKQATPAVLNAPVRGSSLTRAMYSVRYINANHISSAPSQALPAGERCSSNARR